MKQSLFVLAALSAAAGAATAQSSVSIFGTIDVDARYVKADGQSRRLSETTDGINSSQLGFRGTEDLGDGLKANFTLISGVNIDNGTTSTKLFNRRSTVSLLGKFGEVRLGRDYLPTFLSQAILDAFGFNGVGNTVQVRQLYGGTRSDNAIQYFLPSNLGGVYGSVMVAASEGGTELDVGGRYIGTRFGYASGPFDIAIAAGQARHDNQPGAPTQKTYNVGGTYDFGVFKLLGYFDRETQQSLRENLVSISTIIPIGLSEVHLGYDRSKFKNALGVSSSVDQIKATYQYNLSKRTAIYTTASRLDNKDGTRFTIGQAAGPTTIGGKSQGIEFGLRHFF